MAKKIKVRIAQKEENIDIDKILAAQGAKRPSHVGVSTSEVYPHCEGINGNWGHVEIIPVETADGKFGYIMVGAKRDQSVIDAENKQILEKMARACAEFSKRHKDNLEND